MTRLLRVAFSVPTSEAESARAWLIEHFAAGFEECAEGEATQLVVYTDDAGRAEIVASYPQAGATRVEDGWESRWKEFHRPVRAAELWIGPPWIDPPQGAAAVVVDPGLAFGTGAHPTTRACIELLAGLDRGSVLDAGCGSGVVAAAAARLGFGPVHAVDRDDVAVGVARRTAAENEVEVEVVRADVLHAELPPVDVVVANIELAVVERLLRRVRDGVVVTSGYPASATPAAPGWTCRRRLELEGWAADVLERPLLS